MAQAIFSIICFLCVAIGICLPIWTIYGFQEIKKYGEYPSVEHRQGSLLTFSCTIWCISCILIPLFVYIMYIVYGYSFAHDFYVRLVLYSLQLYLTLNILIVKICKLHYTINLMIDAEKWFCCHMIDKYWLHSLYIINYEIFGRGSNLLLFCSVYLCFAVLMITFCGLLSDNLLIEYCAFLIMAILPLILFGRIYKNEKYFVDDDYMLKEIFALILVYILYIVQYDIVLFTHIMSNTIACALSVFISLRCGVWAATHRQRIIQQERDKLCGEYNTYYDRADLPLANINESNTDHVPPLTHTRLMHGRYMHLHSHSTLKTNKARTPMAKSQILAMSSSTDDDEDEMMENPYKFARKTSNSVQLDSMEKVFFASEYLRKQNALHYLAFIAEMDQFKRELYGEMKYKKTPVAKRKYEWICSIDLQFLPRGDCQYINRHNIVFHAWNIYKKYIGSKHKQMHSITPALPQEMVLKIGTVLENIYQHYQFLYSQKKYYFKYQKQRQSISEKYHDIEPFESRESISSSAHHIHAMDGHKNGYESLNCDEDDCEYETQCGEYELLLDEEEDAPPIDVEPLVLSNCATDDDSDGSEEFDAQTINRILLLNDIGNRKAKDIWSVIEETSNAKISVESSTLDTLSHVFEDAIYLIWDELLQHYKIFQNKCDDYLLCRHKLRGSSPSQRDYMRQKMNQKIKTPRNRTDPIPFWRKKSKSKAKISAFTYNKKKVDQIQIVQYNQ
eukprot:467503_1